MSELAQAIGRVRRAMPRNGDVMLICDEAEKMMARSSVVERVIVPAVLAPAVPVRPKLTRGQIQKNYRERQREKKK